MREINKTRIKADRDRKLAEWARINDGHLHSAFKEMMNSDSGLEVLGWLFALTGFTTSSYTGNADTYFKEGRRSIGESLYNLAKLVYKDSPHAFGKFVLFMDKKQSEYNTFMEERNDERNV